MSFFDKINNYMIVNVIKEIRNRTEVCNNNNYHDHNDDADEKRQLISIVRETHNMDSEADKTSSVRPHEKTLD